MSKSSIPDIDKRKFLVPSDLTGRLINFRLNTNKSIVVIITTPNRFQTLDPYYYYLIVQV